MAPVEAPWIKIGGLLRRAGWSPREPYQPPTTALNSTPHLPFDLAVYRQAMRQSPRKAWLHGFLTFPLGGDGFPFPNSPTWDLDRLTGGPVRMALGANDDPALVSRDWLLRDVLYDPYRAQRADGTFGALAGVPPEIRGRIWECLQADAAGFDGEMPDTLNLNEGSQGTGDNRWGQLKDLVSARQLAFGGDASTYPIQPMLDGNTSISRATARATLITKLKALASQLYQENGRVQIAVYMPEAGGPASKTGTAAEVVEHWSALQTEAAAAGLQFDYSVMCTQRGNQDSSTPSVPGWAGTTLTGQQGYGAALAPLTKRLAKWGSRNPEETLRQNSANALAAQYSRDVLGRPFMPPVSIRDSRPNQRKFEECLGFSQLRASMQVAVTSGADWIHLPTRSDMAEHAHLQPSHNHGYTSYDLLSYYLAYWKLGIWPTILTDTVYITHRIHRNSGYVCTDPNMPRPARTGSTSEADIVEALVFLIDPAGVTVEITSGTAPPAIFAPSDNYKVFGGPGVYSFTADLRVGPPPSARIYRDGRLVAQVVSKWSVVASGPTYDKDYRSASSGRQQQGAPV